MSSSGLIYAVIVGAWAAYLVPMWLRRQDELNEARPTERFSTAIRLLAGRSAMERRASRALGDDTRDHDDSEPAPASVSVPASDSASTTASDAMSIADGGSERSAGSASASAGADSAIPERASERAPHEVRPAHGPTPHGPTPHDSASHGSVERRARLLARRRRMVTTLFLAFAIGAVVAAVAGIAFLWVPALPAALLTLYIGHLRRLERQRYEVKLDRVRAAQAAELLRDRERARGTDGSGERSEHQESSGRRGAPRPAHPAREAVNSAHDAAHAADPGRPHLRLAADPGPHAEERPGARASALVEATDHEEWVDGMRERGAAGPDSWEPVPVPLPTYVTAPVAPRITRGLDLGAPGTWDSGRSAEPRKTPLFDQYAEPAAPPPADDYATRPRAANE